MEWMLQVVDELTDTLDHARFRAVDFGTEIGLAGCALLAAAVLGAAAACGAPALVLAGALGALGAAVLLKARHHLVPAVDA
jgi:hypothetical protein